MKVIPLKLLIKILSLRLTATKVCVNELINKLFNNPSSYNEGNQIRDSGLDNFVMILIGKIFLQFYSSVFSVVLVSTESYIKHLRECFITF